MTKARRVLAETMPKQDVIIEVLDARMPAASANPIVTELRGGKPCIKVLSKSDLADPKVTKEWISRLEGGNVLAVALSSAQPGETRKQIADLSKRLVTHSKKSEKPVRAMIVGIPNVGKSTLINTLMDRKVAKVGDEPAVTKATQIVVLKSGMVLLDNPGLLWPNIESSHASTRLALGGAIPDTAIDYEIVASFGARYFLAHYPELLMARYKLAAVPAGPDELLQEIGRRRGCLRAGGVVDVHKAADVLLHDFRAGKLGRISLEEPFRYEAPSDVEQTVAEGDLDLGEGLVG